MNDKLDKVLKGLNHLDALVHQTFFQILKQHSDHHFEYQGARCALPSRIKINEGVLKVAELDGNDNHSHGPYLFHEYDILSKELSKAPDGKNTLMPVYRLTLEKKRSIDGSGVYEFLDKF